MPHVSAVTASASPPRDFGFTRVIWTNWDRRFFDNHLIINCIISTTSASYTVNVSTVQYHHPPQAFYYNNLEDCKCYALLIPHLVLRIKSTLESSYQGCLCHFFLEKKWARPTCVKVWKRLLSGNAKNLASPTSKELLVG